MVQRIVTAVTLSLLLAGCGGNPFQEETEEPTTENPVEELPGTDNPSASSSIERYETASETGDGYAEDITRNADGTYSVDNLAFDGDNIYRRNAALDLGPFEVYESLDVVNDPVSGNPIGQFPHRLVAGLSESKKTQFAIVRTGVYEGYGFGGFVMKRDGGVNLPTSSGAVYSGEYAGLQQDSNGSGGLRYTTGDVTIAFDFEDFNNGDANYGVISNRRVLDINGNDVTASVISAMNAEFNPNNISGGNVSQLPVIAFHVGPGTVDANGEIRGILDNSVMDYSSGTGTPVTYEAGNYYGIIAGDGVAGTDEIVGIIVVESSKPGFDGITTRETGGFIAYR